MSENSLGAEIDVLLATISDRADADPKSSYTAELLSKGVGKAAEKLGEEAVEAVVSALQGDKPGLTKEAADVLYHLGVLLTAAGVEPEAVAEELRSRQGQSGLEEKASRRT